MAERQIGEMRLTISAHANPEFEDFLHQQIKEFNNEHSVHHLQARAAGVEPLIVLVRDAAGEMLGGLVGSTYWQWLDIDNFWLRSELRGQGIGRELLGMAEAEAQSRGCVRVTLTTFGFQARGFYEKQGYRVVGTLEDYPPGNAMYWMRKDFGDYPSEVVRNRKRIDPDP